ncbi:NAD(P)/FAD-dependent oxidoreductase [Rhodococcus sp. IEGM 1305]|uniref:flavin-containing monooxygenase n=1 Tax=Rhodococcus sp. IEGM 1305 TaxID=3047092 RepID=UPI0024B7144F|nr:NAD(P)/FAD-dependent oxidoreductase [Rhodococcus sp. IEGM 1305]MDI9953295.1 NAD(P)/FAD-dependent oxidoreductase [Rhodococcus sp. IEGM 1305]
MSESVLTGTPANLATDEDHQLRLALKDANLPTLMLVLAHLTGDTKWIHEPYTPRKGKPLDDNDSAGLPAELGDEVRAAAYDAVTAVREGRLVPGDLTPEQVAEYLEIALGEEVPRSYGPLLSEELGLLSRDVDVHEPPSGFSALVVGTGMSGLCAAIKLQEAGIDYMVIEKDPDVGGAWLENVYPGCGVDTPSHLYSFSFDPNTRWSRYFAKRDELHSYFARLTDENDLRKNIRFNTEVLGAVFDEESNLWRVTIRNPDSTIEELTTTVLITAVGMVNRPSIPALAGLDTFDGPTLHTAAWDQSVEIAGKRVAVVGTGASAMQLVPSIADEAERVLVFQRSKQWALPHPNYQRDVSEGVRHLMDHVPYYSGWYRLRAFWNFSDRLHPDLQIDPTWEHPERAINAANDRHRIFLTKYITEQLGDRTDLIEACVPDYPPYSKRALLDNGWFATMTRDDVDLITDAVAEIREHSLVTRGGEEYDADVIVFATGFKILQFLAPMEIIGKGGVVLREQWGDDDARAYLGITVPNFPNLFVLNGPNTNAGHGGSAVIAAEFQVRYIMQALDHLVTHDVGSVEIRQEPYEQYNRELDDALGHSIWAHHGTTTYHRNAAGRVVVSSPWKYLDYWKRTLNFDPSEYEERPAPTSA